MPSNRDPRTDPKVGDVLEYYGQRMTIVAIDSIGNINYTFPGSSRQHGTSRLTWVTFMGIAEVIHAAD